METETTKAPTFNQRSDVFLPLLRSNDRSLRELILANTCITKPTIDMIGDALKGNKSLLQLDLSSNDLADEDLHYFISSCLRKNLGLTTLNISGNKRVTKATMERLLDVIRVDNDSLTSIITEGTSIDDRSVNSFTELAALNRYPSDLKQQVFRAMNNDPDLFKIVLKYDKSDPKVINEVGIATLARALTHGRNGSDNLAESSPSVPSTPTKTVLVKRDNNTVRTLILDGGCCRGERCVEALLPVIATNPFIKTVGLSHNFLGDESVRMLCGAIKTIGDNCGLEDLDFSYNEITDEGLNLFIKCLATNSSIRSVVLIGNKTPLSPHLLQLLQQGTALNCEPSSMKTAIEKIKKGYPKNLTKEAEKEIYVRQSIGEFTDERGILELKGTDRDSGKGPSRGYFTSLGASTIAAALPNNITIHTINFQNNHIGPEGAKALAQILEYNPTIVRIDLRNNPIKDEGAKHFLIALKTNDTLVSLNLTEGCDVSQHLLDEIAAFTHLNLQSVPIKQYLKYEFNAAPSTDLILRRRNEQVRGKWKSLFPPSIQYVLSILAAQPKITILDVSDNDTLGDEGIMLLVDWLKNPRCKLKRLDISNTGITDATVDAISSAIRSNYSLTSVVVSGNRDVRTRPRQGLDEVLALNEFPPAVKDIVPLLKNNISGITSVSFIRRKDEYFKKELKIPPPAPLGDDTARVIFQSLMENTRVASVALKNQQISNRGLQYASQCLDVNPTITEIDLSDNMIGPDGILEFAEMLERNTSLTRINLSGNPIGIDGGNRLLLAMQTANRTVTYIKLTDCRMREDTRMQIEALASFNTQSTSFRHLVLSRITSASIVYYRGGCNNSEDKDPLAKHKQDNGASDEGLNSGRNNGFDSPIFAATSATSTTPAPDFLDDAAIDALAMALASRPSASRKNDNVKAVHLPYNHITDVGCRRLLRLLHRYPTIVDVDLSNNPITDSVSREIAVFLTMHPHVKRFVVGNVEDDGLDGNNRSGRFEHSYLMRHGSEAPNAEDFKLMAPIGDVEAVFELIKTSDKGASKKDGGWSPRSNGSGVPTDNQAPAPYIGSSSNAAAQPAIQKLSTLSGGNAEGRLVALGSADKSSVLVSPQRVTPTSTVAPVAGSDQATSPVAKTAKSRSELSPICEMSPLAIRHVQIAAALNYSPESFRRQYMQLSHQLLRWCDLRAHLVKVQRSRLAIGNRSIRETLKQVAGGEDFIENGGTANGAESDDPVALAIMRECEDEFVAEKAAAIASGHGGAHGGDMSKYIISNPVATEGGGPKKLSVRSQGAMLISGGNLSKEGHHNSTRKELAQLVAAAAPEVVRLDKEEVGNLQLRLVMNLLVRPLEGIIVNNVNFSNSVWESDVGAEESSSILPSIEQLPPSSIFGPSGPISQSVAAVPDGEVLRRHVRGLSFSGNADLNDGSVELLISEYLVPTMEMVGATDPHNSSVSVNTNSMSMSRSQTAAMASSASPAPTHIPLFLQALVLDGCNIQGHCLRSLYTLAQTSHDFVILSLEHSPLTSAIAQQILKEEGLTASVAESSSDVYASASMATPTAASKGTATAFDSDLMNQPLNSYDPEEREAIVHLYRKARATIDTVLAGNRQRMVAIAADELFASHKLVGAGLGTSGLQRGSTSVRPRALMPSTSNANYGSSSPSPSLVAADGEAQNLTLMGGGNNTLNASKSNPRARFLESSLQYGRANREAIPTTFDEFKANEDSILTDAIAAAPKRIMGSAAHVMSLYGPSSNANSNNTNNAAANGQGKEVGGLDRHH